MKNGGWIFISHSHQDVDKVRKIRNRLESLGFEPLMFYLKCLSDENEIEELIKREIDEREWFIYADSPSARASKWVKTEREYIEKLTGKKIFTIDLSKDVSDQLGEIEHISTQMKVFISHARKDAKIGGAIADKLISHDMLVIGDDSSYVESRESGVLSAVEDASRNGFVVVLVTENSMNSRFIKCEIEKALACGGKIIPVFVDKATLSPEFLAGLGDIEGVRISSEPTDEQLERIVDNISYRIKYNKSNEHDFEYTCGFSSAKHITLPEISRIDSLLFADCENLECVRIPDSVIYISADAFSHHPDILVECSEGGYAEQYCKLHSIKYKIV